MARGSVEAQRPSEGWKLLEGGGGLSLSAWYAPPMEHRTGFETDQLHIFGSEFEISKFSVRALRKCIECTCGK